MPRTPNDEGVFDPGHDTGWVVEVLRAFLAFVRRYHRLEVVLEAPWPDEPCLIVGNHGFGTLTDLAVAATLAALEDAHVHRPATILVHELAWTFEVGRLLEAIGCRPAGPEVARRAFREGRNVLVFPGWAEESGKSFADRNLVMFAGRSGFARLAIEQGVPVVPIVTAGAGESLFVLTDGRSLAHALGLAKRFRYGVLPISISIPWGLSVGVAGFLPYLPLPTKLDTTVLPPMRPREGEPAEAFAERVRTAMQERMDRMVRGRIPLLGRLLP